MKNVEKTENAIFSTNTTEIKTTQKTIRKEIRTTSQKVFTETYQKKSVTDCLPTHNHQLIKDQNIPIKSSKNTEKLKQHFIKKEISKEKKIPSLDRKIDLSPNLYKDKARDIHNEESFKLLLKQTEDFLKNQVYSVDKNTNPKETISVISPSSKDEQTMKDKISQTSIEKTFVRNIPLKKYQDCHEQKNEQNDFHKEAEKLDPKTLISPKMGESKTIITKVKNVLSPHRPRKAESPLSSQQPLKSNDLEEEAINRFLRSQNEEFLSKHKYHIHKEEVDFNKSPLSTKLLTREKTIVPQSIVKKDVEVQENETSKEHPMKEGKQKKSTFSKIKSLMSGTKTTDKDNALLKKQTQEFLSNLREYDANQKETHKKFRIIWLSDQKLNVEEIRSPKHITSASRPIDKEYDHKMFLLRKQQTESFLKDHQDYHIQQMKEHSDFLKRTGKHDHEIWLASTLPASDVKKGKNILSKVKNLLTTQQPGKEKGLPIAMSYPYLKDETEEFLRKHQYLIHKEEIDFKSHNIEIKSKAPNEMVLSKTMSPEQMVSPKSKSKNISLSGDDKKERSIISRIKSSITGTIDQDLMKKQNDQLRNQTKEFLDDIKKYDHMERDAWTKYKVLWLNDQTKNIKGNIAEKSVAKKHDHKMFLLVLQQTNSFLEDHKDYHNKQRSGYNDFLHKAGKPERDIWISSKMKEKQKIITKVKNLLSPQQRLKQNDPEQEERHRFLKSQTEEFLRKHQYLIHKEEVDFKKLPLSTKSVINEETVIPQTITKEEVVPHKREISKELPIKEGKQKKSTFSKIKSLMSGTRNTDSFNKDNELLRKHTQEFLNHLRQYDENEKEACKKFRVTWLNDQKSNEKEIRSSKPITSAPTSIDKEYDHKMFLLLKQQTESFLKDHQDYHIQQTKEHNEFLKKSGKNIMKKVRNLLTTQQPIKEKNVSEIKSSPYLKDETEEFLRKHQYLIHKEEIVFKTPNIAIETKASEEMVFSKTMSPEQTVNHQSKTKIIPSSRDDKNKKGIFSKIKSSFSGTTDSDSMKIQNEQLRKQTKEFLDETRKYDDVEREAWSKYNVIWLKDQTKYIEGNMKNKSTNITEKPVVEEHDNKMFLLVLQKTNSFLEDHKDYHNKQRTEYNDFLQKAGIPERDIWISTKMKEKKNIITKVKNLLSPQQRLKPKDSEEDKVQQFLKDQSEEFLRKHRYLIHKEEVDFKKLPLSTKSVINEETVVSQTITRQEVVPQKKEISKEHPIKEGKQKKSTFSKIKSLMSGTRTTDSSDKDNELLRKHTQEFLNHLRQYDENEKEACKKFRVTWLNDQKSNEKEIRSSKPITSAPTSIDKEYDHKMFLLLKQQTESFLKDHQDYHIQQTKEHNEFLKKSGKHYQEIWLSSAPPSSNMKKGKNIMKKVRNLLTTQQPIKEKNVSEIKSSPYLKDETEEFLRKHQYLIHKEEIVFKTPNIAIETKASEEIVFSKTMSPEQTVNHQSKTKIIPSSRDDKNKKGIFSKIKSSFSGTTDSDSMKIQNEQLRKQTKEFLDETRKYDDVEREAWSKYNVIWLKDQTKYIEGNMKNKSTNITEKPVVEEHDNKMFLLVLQKTNSFLEDHKDYHNKQRTEYNDFLQKAGIPERDIWISTKMKEKKNIITKVKNLLSPQQRLKPKDSEEDKVQQFLKDQSEEFLRKHRYLIHKEEVDFKKLPLSTKSVINEETVVSQTITRQEVVPQKKEISKEHPIKEGKQKKSTFSKIKSLMSGTRTTDSSDKDNELLRKHTQEFLNHLRQYDENEKEACKKFRVTWLNDQKSNEKEIRSSKPITSAPTSIDKEYDHKMFLLLKQQTESFLKDHQDYHIQQTKEHNEFLKKSERKEYHEKVRNLLTTQQPIKEKNVSEIKSSPYLKDETEEFLRKHQYLIHKEEIVFKTPNIAIETKASEEIVFSKTMSPEQTVNHQSKTKIIPSSRDDKNKKGIFSKIKSSFSGTTDSDSMKIQNEQLRKQTKEFLDETRKYDDVEREAWSKYNVIWLKDQTKYIEGNMKNKSTNITEKPVVEEHDNKMFLLVLQKTNSFLEDHKDYHNKQRTEYNDFLQKAGIPERDIWISTKMKEKKNIITKVKNLLSPQQRLKPKDSEEDKVQQFLKDQSEEFLRKHRYLIHKEEVDFKKLPLSTKSVINEETVVSQTITRQEVVPQKKEISKEHPIKEGKQKKSTFSKIKSLMSGTRTTDSSDKDNELLRKHTQEFLNHLRQYDENEKEACKKFRVTWLNDQKSNEKEIRSSKPITSAPTSIDKEYDHKMFLLLKQQTESFLKDHQDYHIQQTKEHNEFLKKSSKHYQEIWLSSAPPSSNMKKGKNIMKKSEIY
ncbi:hypothetical protein HHI36_007621 [Cryptolaemus montrouzieri]|uniref:Uncharacterized protein n=1 Tax=Cryptolaemus montrouzieri TaxID=559131 RepID=A0ABD2MQ23_9CUCU